MSEIIRGLFSAPNSVVKFLCEKCGATGNAELKLKMNEGCMMNIGPAGKFTVGACPVSGCDGKLIVPPGSYKSHEGLLVYVGPLGETPAGVEANT